MLLHKIKRLTYYICNKPDVLVIDFLHIIAPLLPDTIYLKLNYRLLMGIWPNLRTPIMFNEKLQWLKIHDRKSVYTDMVDKFTPKRYVADIIGEEYIIPTIGVYNRIEDVKFNLLPAQFVMKCSHDSGGIVICKDKSCLDVKNAIAVIKSSMKRNFYPITREWPYKNVEPRILVEKYMVDESGYELKDYKFFCFSGHVEFFKVDFDRSSGHRANYYNTNMELLPFGEIHCPPDNSKSIVFPENMKQMIEIAEKLSKGHPFLRVDLYNVNGNIYFGELTFFPASGFSKFTDDNWDTKIGKILDLSTV